MGKFYRLHGAAAGSPGQLQFNSFGVMGADASLSFNTTTKTLSLSGVPATTQYPFEISGDNGTIRLAMTDSEEVFGLEIRSVEPPGGGYVNDVGIAGWYRDLRVFRLEAWDSRSSLQLWHYTADVEDQALSLSTDGAEFILQCTGAFPFRIENSGADMLVKTSGDLGLWSGQRYVEIGPPNSATGDPGGPGTGHTLSFRDFNDVGESRSLGEIRSLWVDPSLTTHRMELSGGVGVLLDPGLLLRSPNGTEFLLTVSNGGALTTTAI